MKNVQQVNQYLADLSVWNVKLHNLHFNVTGPQFKSIHEYLESIYDEAFEYFDAVGELGQEDIPQHKVIEILLHDFKYMKDQAAAIREAAGEEDNFLLSNMMEDHIEYYVKQIWFIESMLK